MNASQALSDGGIVHRRLERPPSLADAVYTQLRASIVALEVKPGERLVTDRLAASLGVSRTPVREALLRLLEDRLVEEVGPGAVRATPITASYAREIFETRAAIEAMATLIAIPRIPDYDLARLEQRLAVVAGDLRRGDPTSYFEFELEFHEQIIAWAGNRYLTSIWQTLRSHVERLRTHWRRLPHLRIETSHEEHEALVVAIVRRDAESAKRLMEAHLLNTGRRMASYFAETIPAAVPEGA